MSTKTYQEQLESVQDAIEKIEGGAQEYSIGGRAFKRGDLAILYQREQFLRNCVRRESQGGISYQLGVIE